MESRLTFIRHDHFKEYKTKKGYITKIPYNLYQCECGKTKVIRRGPILKKRLTNSILYKIISCKSPNSQMCRVEVKV